MLTSSGASFLRLGFARVQWLIAVLGLQVDMVLYSAEYTLRVAEITLEKSLAVRPQRVLINVLLQKMFWLIRNGRIFYQIRRSH